MGRRSSRRQMVSRLHDRGRSNEHEDETHQRDARREDPASPTLIVLLVGSGPPGRRRDRAPGRRGLAGVFLSASVLEDGSLNLRGWDRERFGGPHRRDRCCHLCDPCLCGLQFRLRLGSASSSRVASGSRSASGSRPASGSRFPSVGSKASGRHSDTVSAAPSASGSRPHPDASSSSASAPSSASGSHTPCRSSASGSSANARFSTSGRDSLGVGDSVAWTATGSGSKSANGSGSSKERRTVSTIRS